MEVIEFENLGKVNKPFFEEYKASFNHSLESGWYILGKNVSKFEKDFSGYCGSKFCIGVGNGLDALKISIKSLDIPEGSEIIVPSNTFIASILSIIHTGCIPVLVEPDIETYTLNPSLIEEKITVRTKAIMVVHLYGKMCNMNPIMEVCKRHGLKLIEDCAQAHGAVFEGKKAGAFGDANGFSFYPTKNLGALGDGGGITTNDEIVAMKARKFRNYGSSEKYYNDIIGFNSRLDELQAAFLSIKLKSLDLINEHKRKLATLYFQNLKDDFIKPVQDEKYYDVFHIFNIRHPKRDKLKEYLLKSNIYTEIHYPVPPHRQKCFQNYFKEQCFPISEEIHRTILSLPVSYFHSESDIVRIIEVMNRF